MEETNGQILEIGEMVADGLITHDDALEQAPDPDVGSLTNLTSACPEVLLAVRYAVGLMVIAWGYHDADKFAKSACWTSVAEEDFDLLPSHAVFCENHSEVAFEEWIAAERTELARAIRNYEEEFEEGYGRCVVMSSHPPDVQQEIYQDGRAAMEQESQHHAHLLRDVFGNPFRPVAFDPGWRTDTVVSLAKHLYESRDYSAMPILADALQDAGCEDEAVLAHCRDPQQVHVRGCWVVDLVLGKA